MNLVCRVLHILESPECSVPPLQVRLVSVLSGQPDLLGPGSGPRPGPGWTWTWTWSD